jgi:hypothetical protein
MTRLLLAATLALGLFAGCATDDSPAPAPEGAELADPAGLDEATVDETETYQVTLPDGTTAAFPGYKCKSPKPSCCEPLDSNPSLCLSSVHCVKTPSLCH